MVLIFLAVSTTNNENDSDNNKKNSSGSQLETGVEFYDVEGNMQTNEEMNDQDSQNFSDNKHKNSKKERKRKVIVIQEKNVLKKQKVKKNVDKKIVKFN